MACLRIDPADTRLSTTHCVAIDADAGVLAVGTTRGFCMYNTTPFALLRERFFMGGVRSLALCGQSNLLALVPSLRNRVVLWNDALDEQNDIASVDLAAPVIAVRVHRKCIVVAERRAFHVFSAALVRIATYESHRCSPSALCVSVTEAPLRIAAPGQAKGQVHLVEYRPATPRHPEPSVTRAVAAIPHRPDSIVAALAMSHDGRHVLSASTQGTTIKLLEAATGRVLRQFNRGTTANTIQSMCFNGAATLAAVVTETGTIHMYNVAATDDARVANARSMVAGIAAAVNGSEGATSDGPSNGSIIGSAVSFAQGEFDFAKFSINDCDRDDPRRLFHATLVALRPRDDEDGRATLVVVQADWGRMLRVAVDYAKEARFTSRMDLTETRPFPPQEL